MGKICHTLVNGAACAARPPTTQVPWYHLARYAPSTPPYREYDSIIHHLNTEPIQSQLADQKDDLSPPGIACIQLASCVSIA
jgi:hypothetical protein